MSDDIEKARIQAEARRLQSGMTSADRARFWLGLNRYLSSEAEHAQKLADRERSETSSEKPPEPSET